MHHSEDLSYYLATATGVTNYSYQKLQQFSTLLVIAKAALQAAVIQLLHAHKATAKLGYIATSIFAGIMQEGFCTAEETEEGKADGEGTFKEAEGTVRSHLFFQTFSNLLCLYSDLKMWSPLH